MAFCLQMTPKMLNLITLTRYCNWNIINDMNTQRREERMVKDKEIDSRISQITSSHIETEIQPIFAHIEKTTGK